MTLLLLENPENRALYKRAAITYKQPILEAVLHLKVQLIVVESSIFIFEFERVTQTNTQRMATHDGVVPVDADGEVHQLVVVKGTGRIVVIKSKDRL